MLFLIASLRCWYGQHSLTNKYKMTLRIDNTLEFILFKQFVFKTRRRFESEKHFSPGVFLNVTSSEDYYLSSGAVVFWQSDAWSINV